MPSGQQTEQSRTTIDLLLASLETAPADARLRNHPTLRDDASALDSAIGETRLQPQEGPTRGAGADPM
jgi:hypothetical protein